MFVHLITRILERAFLLHTADELTRVTQEPEALIVDVLAAIYCPLPSKGLPTLRK